MFKGLDHMVVAVKDLDASVKRYETIYGTEVSDRSEAPAAGAGAHPNRQNGDGRSAAPH